MSALRVERLTYRYPEAAVPALRGVSLSVEEGELAVVCGLSGSGKSTLLRAACGLVPHFHGGEHAGRVVTAGLDTRDHGPGELAARCGALFQDPETQVVMGTVRAELAFPLENRGESASAVARGVEEASLALGIAHLLDRPTHELSGGELQRVALAAALAGRPALVVLDEPASQLDPVAGDELIWFLRRLNEEWGTAILLAEHRLERCLPAADRVIALQDGEVACDAAPRGFLEWAAARSPALQTPGALLFERAGLRPPPGGVKEARATLRAHGLLDTAASAPDGPAAREAAGRPPPPEPALPPGARRPSRPEPALPPGARRPSRPEPALPPGARRPSRPEPALRPAAHRPSRPERALRLAGRRPSRPEPALRLRGVWQEWPEGRAALRGVDLAVGTGERVALMGRNGAGKSTLLRIAAGLLSPSRGRVRARGRVALLMQAPGDYLVRDRVADELGPAALERAGLAALADRHPRDLSGGERQRLALAVVLEEGQVPAAVCLDEPTRGMDRARKGELASHLRELAAGGVAVVVATHDCELAATVAERVVLLGDGELVADGPAAEVLAGGWYFATETARILGGAGGALDPAAGAALLSRRMVAEVAP
jgi:energy-coupling factor transporter ATP-binding protein EcfA2